VLQIVRTTAQTRLTITHVSVDRTVADEIPQVRANDSVRSVRRLRRLRRGVGCETENLNTLCYPRHRVRREIRKNPTTRNPRNVIRRPFPSRFEYRPSAMALAFTTPTRFVRTHLARTSISPRSSSRPRIVRADGMTIGRRPPVGHVPRLSFGDSSRIPRPGGRYDRGLNPKRNPFVQNGHYVRVNEYVCRAGPIRIRNGTYGMAIRP